MSKRNYKTTRNNPSQALPSSFFGLDSPLYTRLSNRELRVLKSTRWFQLQARLKKEQDQECKFFALCNQGVTRLQENSP